jgi:hypothetical protein
MASAVPDVKLLAAGGQFRNLRDLFVRARRQSKPSGDITDAMDPVFNRIMALPATAIEGFAVKADIVRHYNEKGSTRTFHGTTSAPCARLWMQFPPSPADRLIQWPKIAFSFACRSLRSPLYCCNRCYFEGEGRGERDSEAAAGRLKCLFMVILRAKRQKLTIGIQLYCLAPTV